MYLCRRNPGSQCKIYRTSHPVRKGHTFADGLQPKRNSSDTSGFCGLRVLLQTVLSAKQAVDAGLLFILAESLIRLPSLLGLGLAHAVHARLLASTALVLHELVRAWAWLIGILVHIGKASTSHGVHCLILLHWSTMHRSATLCMVHLRRGMHGRLLWVR